MRRARARDLNITLAEPDDDPELRRLLRETAMPGAVSLAMCREPDFFLGATVEGDVHQTVVARLPQGGPPAGDEAAGEAVASGAGKGRLVGLGSRAELWAYVNGQEQRLGYFGQLRIEPGFRGGQGLLAGGFERLREEHLRSDVPFYFTTIIEDNRPARRALASGRVGLPTYRELEVIVSLAVPVWRPRRPPSMGRYRIRAATASDLPDISACLRRRYRELQLAPLWRAEDLASPRRCRGLSPGDFLVAESGGGIEACLALWDQQTFKQIVVNRLTGTLARWRPLVNLLGPPLGIPRLPAKGEAFPLAYLSHLALPMDDPALAVDLVTHACNRALGRGYAYVSLGLAARHPLIGALRRAFRHIEYRAVLYAVHWEDGRGAVDALDRRRIPHVEIATL